MHISGGTRDGSQPFLLLSNSPHAKKQKVVTSCKHANMQNVASKVACLLGIFMYK